jgi:hypothetical protein
MTHAPALISAIVTLLATMGVGLKFAWNKYDAWRAERRAAEKLEADRLEQRFSRIENALKECEQREERGDKRRAKMWTIIQLLLDAMEGLDPGHRTLQRAKQLLEEMRLEEAST